MFINIRNQWKKLTSMTLLKEVVIIFLTSMYTTSHVPNVIVEWLTHLLLLLKVPGTNLRPETGYPESFRGFPQAPQANAGVVP
jgi:hypothetical protein